MLAQQTHAAQDCFQIWYLGILQQETALPDIPACRHMHVCVSPQPSVHVRAETPFRRPLVIGDLIRQLLPTWPGHHIRHRMPSGPSWAHPGQAYRFCLYSLDSAR